MFSPYTDLSKPLFIGATLISAWVSGHIATDSRSGIATKLSARTDRAALAGFAELYESGKATNPPLAILAALCAWGAAYTHAHAQAPHRARLFIASGVLSVLIAPWTWVVMKGTNDALFAKRDEAERLGKAGVEEKTEDVQALLRTWRVLNLGRALLPLTGALCAFEAL